MTLPQNVPLTLHEAPFLKGSYPLGYSGIVFGVESGDDKILKFMNKGYKANEIVPKII
jgi:radical SAM superfamily enzyme YgiQ (UPF0313 family)